jgi:hypothetical protein
LRTSAARHARRGEDLLMAECFSAGKPIASRQFR